MASVLSKIFRLLTPDMRPGYVREFQQAVREAVQDGMLTEQEIAELERMREELHIGETALAEIRQDLYVAAFHAIAEKDSIRDDEWDALEHIQDYLGLEDAEIAPTKKELYRLRILSELQNGNMPVMQDDALRLKQGEVLHWKERVELLRPGKGKKMEFRGITLPLLILPKLRLGTTQEQAVDGWVKQDSGELYVTSKALLFAGAKETQRIPFSSVALVRCFTSGIRIDEKQKPPRFFMYNQKENARLTGSIVVSAMDLAM